MICLVLPTSALSGAIIFGLGEIPLLHNRRGLWISDLTFAILLLVLVLLVIGKGGRKSLIPRLRLPSIRYLCFGALIPALIAYVWPVASYAYARIYWNAFEHLYPPPDVGLYFVLPPLSSLGFLVPALVEEIAWRGYLQPRFIRRYGLGRGVFLVGLVWGAFHFSWDFHGSMNDQGEIFELFSRLLGTVVLSYSLAWLTIQSRSVLPAALAHATYNAFITDYSFTFRTPRWPAVFLWAAVGYALFRYFPVPQAIKEKVEDGLQSTPEPATGG